MYSLFRLQQRRNRSYLFSFETVIRRSGALCTWGTYIGAEERKACYDTKLPEQIDNVGLRRPRPQACLSSGLLGSFSHCPSSFSPARHMKGQFSAYVASLCSVTSSSARNASRRKSKVPNVQVLTYDSPPPPRCSHVLATGHFRVKSPG